MTKMNPVVHFEMPYDNYDRLARFYSQTFGWKMQNLGREMGDYVMAETAETDENGMTKKPGTINGGFFPKSDDRSAQSPSVVIAVDDIKLALETIKKEGGKIFADPVEIPGIGQYASFVDPEGNRVGILEPLMK